VSSHGPPRPSSIFKLSAGRKCRDRYSTSQRLRCSLTQEIGQPARLDCNAKNFTLSLSDSAYKRRNVCPKEKCISRVRLLIFLSSCCPLITQKANRSRLTDGAGLSGWTPPGHFMLPVFLCRNLPSCKHFQIKVKYISILYNTVILRLKSDPANEFFG